MVQYISEAQHLLLTIGALMRCCVVPEMVVERRQRHGREVWCGARVRAARAIAVRHLDEPTHQPGPGVMRAESTVQNISLLIPNELNCLFWRHDYFNASVSAIICI